MNVKLVAEKTFNLLKGFGFEVSSYNKEGDLVIDPMEATRFAVESPNILVRIDPLDKHLSLKTGNPGESIEKLRPMLKELAQDYLLDFDYSVFDKQIKPKGEKLDVAKKKNEDDVMSEEMEILRKLAGLSEAEKQMKNFPTSVGNMPGYIDSTPLSFQDYYDWEMETSKDKPKSNIVSQRYAIYKADFEKYVSEALEENPDLLDPPGSDIKFGQDKDEILGFTPDENSFYKMLKTFHDKNQLEIVDPISRSPERPEKLDPEIARIAYNDFYKKGEKDPISAYAQASAKMHMGYKSGDFSEQDTLDRPSLDQDLPQDYFTKLASVKKTILKQYGDNDRTLNIFNRLNDEEKAKGKKADPNNIMKQVSFRFSENINEASLGKMTGSRKSSYQPLADSVKIIVRHNKDVNEEVRGARSRNIHSILIQRGEEKFKMAENNLSAARAMARHLHNGGETFDEIGNAITEMSKEFRTLKEFLGYVRKAKLINEDNEEFVNLAIENINTIKNTFKRLSGVKSYANAVESVYNYNNVEVLQDDLDLEAKFTETHFDDKVANAMENLKRMSSRKKSFENYITKAIESESFSGLKDMIAEDELLEFESLNQQLGHRVHALGSTASDNTLGKYLHSISDKLNAGGQLSQFEYGAIKSCLLSAGQHNVSNAPMSVEESYEAFMDRFDV